MRRSAHASGLDQLDTAGCIRVIKPLHIEGVESIQFHAESHLIPNWEDFDERKVNVVVLRPLNDGFHKRIPLARRVSDRNWISFV